jgi:glucose/arabinose dehydrogenase
MKQFSQILLLIVIPFICCINPAISQKKTAKKARSTAAKGGLTLPAGFKATVIARDLGAARHLAVNSKGHIYVKLDGVKNGAGIIELSPTANNTSTQKKAEFGHFEGTGIAIKNGYLYASSNSDIFRYKLDDNGQVADTGTRELIVKGLIDRGQHNSKSITLDNDGNIYVNIGAYSNSCQEKDRQNGSKGMDPCPILDSAGGIWQFRADKENQTYADGVRYGTGLRNVVGLDWNSDINQLFVMQHGRDQIGTMFPEYFQAKYADEIPAEEMFMVKKGMNFGWPYCYYDPMQQKKFLAPEYGGDGKQVGRCAEMENPVVAFPAHMAPNALLFYTGNMFPEKYKNGAFIAFHGSWNRNITGQEGYFVAFVPFKDGKPNGKWEIFANGFAGVAKIASTGDAKYRPCGLAQAPDGALYISDDNKGNIWRVTYNGK